MISVCPFDVKMSIRNGLAYQMPFKKDALVKTRGFFRAVFMLKSYSSANLTPGTSSFTVLNLPAGRTCSTRRAAGVVSPA